MDVGVAGAGVAVDAAVLAAAIGIDRLLEGDVRRIVAADDRAGRFRAHLGGDGIGYFCVVPAVVDRLVDQPGVASRRIGAGATTLERAFHRPTVRIYSWSASTPGPPLTGQKGAVGGVGRFLGVGVTERVQMAQEILPVRLGHLDTGEYPPLVRAVIADVDQGVVPSLPDRYEISQQRSIA